ncbi:YIP1 family protein [Streptomyces sp. SID8379]|uniref:Yip1 family protein n=1 Tax=unclassified Streptomyces TaxID=2593676 RepID=UPI000996C283|nr:MULTISPECIES: Yip1 family protein [unclassified Streptomyces]MYW68784.1 YIP1 family protein [Streptomyces sp. SID8379]
MSQLSANAGPNPPGPASHPRKPGTFDYVAGFRNGRGRDNREAPQGPPQYYGGGGQQQWPQGNNGGGGYGEPEYFGDHQGQGQGQGGHDPYAANNPGHTQAFSVNDDPYTQGSTYQAGSAQAGPVGPRLHWKELLTGVVFRPSATYLQMRDYAMWAPALIVTFLYGLLAIFGFDGAREDVINATLSSAIPYVLTTGVAVTLSFFVLGVVTHTLARQLGGDGAWQPTVGLSMLIVCLTDAPRLLVGMFLGGNEMFVQLLGWATWIAAGALLTTMVSKSHDLPWPKALAASAIQLVALLSIVKLGTF